MEQVLSKLDEMQGPENEVDVTPETFYKSWFFAELDKMINAQPNFPESTHPKVNSYLKEDEKYLQANVFISCSVMATRSQSIVVKTRSGDIFYFFRNTELSHEPLANWKYWHFKKDQS